MNLNYGRELYTFFLIPTIRVYSRYKRHTEIEIVWLKWFFGIQIWKEGVD